MVLAIERSAEGTNGSKLMSRRGKSNCFTVMTRHETAWDESNGSKVE